MMYLIEWCKDKVSQFKKTMIKSRLRGVVNDKLRLGGELDEYVDIVADKAIDKIGVENIINLSNIFNKLANNKS